MKLPTQSFSTNWKNIFGLQVNGTQDREPGSRIPSVYIFSHGSAELYFTPNDKMDGFSHAIRQNNNLYYATIGLNLDTNNWINLKISQSNGVFEIRLNDQLVRWGTNINPKVWTNVDVVMGNTYGNQWESATGEYRNFEITSFSSKSKMVEFAELKYFSV